MENVKRLFLIVLCLAFFSCSECKEDSVFKTNFQNCLDIVDLVHYKGYYSDLGTRLHAFECLIAITGYEGSVDLFGEPVAIYTYREDLDKDLNIWKQWYEANKCSFTLAKADSLIARYREVIGDPELTWPVRDSVKVFEL
ncbi:hypothetical protein [uncultured Alistipes sp.]|jgi:hypothetical protein|uniref:hypothetical protein n=1 Tax=uncultured Alistipes sp. TaxID=538949 RepID=UPI0025D556DB|nr:hypothetical protein [uncultured Alistipes sp.]